MKTKIVTLLFILVAGIEMMNAAKIDGINYVLDTENLTAEVSSNRNISGDVIIPSTVLFEGKSYSVTSIGGSAFEECSGLTSIEIPNSVISIGDNAFTGCSSLTSITISNSITSIGRRTFSGCRGLTSVTIPNSVTSIGDYAFSSCSGLTEIIIPENVTSIGDHAFYLCSGLTRVTIGNSVISIGEYAFGECKDLTSLTIGNSVTSIGSYSFSGCSGLTSLTIPNSVISIGFEAFIGCSGLTSLTIPYGVTSINTQTFSFCSGLTSIICEAQIPPSGQNMFLHCDNLSSIYVPCGTLSAYKQSWSNYANIIKYQPLEYSTIGNVNDAEAGIVTCPSTICDDTIISAVPNYGYHFMQWSDGIVDNPRMFILAQDTTFTAEFALDRSGKCGNDLALNWSYDPEKHVLTISGEGVFNENMQCGVEAKPAMTHLVIDKGITSIGENAFNGCSDLSHLTLGESVKTINNNAFYNCVNLTTIINYRPTPTNAYSTAFDGVDKFECTLYVLAGSMELYQNASVWRDFYYKKPLGATETTTTDDEVKVDPQDNAVTLTWPTEYDAASYTIEITKDGEVICTLVFNANGQLTGIAFAPSRDATRRALAAIQTVNGLQFTVTGLNSGTDYSFNLTAKDASDAVIASYSGTFKTTGTTTGVDEIVEQANRVQKVLYNGQLLILRNGEVYNATGARVE